MLHESKHGMGTWGSAFGRNTGASKSTILVVDDEPQLVTALSDALDDKYIVIGATSAERALTILESNKDIQVILSDQRMPGLTGDQFLARANEISTATRILVTAYADLEAVISAVNGGKIYNYVRKPWDNDALLAIVDAAALRFTLTAALQQEKQLLDCIMECSIDAISIKDVAHRYVCLNTAEAKLLGAEALSEARGKSHRDFLDVERAASWDAEEQQLLAKMEALLNRVEYVVDEDGSKRWYSTVKTPIRDASGEALGLVSVTRDVTETKCIEQIKDDFIATVRHELRTPLTVILSSIKLACTGALGNLPPKIHDLLQRGGENCDRLLVLINNILDIQDFIGGAVEFDMGPVDIHDLVYESITQHCKAAEKNETDVRIDGVIPDLTVVADRTRLTQALANLLSNACRFSPLRSEVRVMVFDLGDAVQISVIDEGEGVPAAFVDKLFDRFTQADNSASRKTDGAGLGLSICKAIVDAHGGQVGYRRNADEGSEFFIRLPLKQLAVATEPEKARGAA
jgi:PAS domain S-box-containing protein